MICSYFCMNTIEVSALYEYLYEQAKAYFLELMMTTDGEEHERAECVYIQLIHGLSECSDKDE